MLLYRVKKENQLSNKKDAICSFLFQKLTVNHEHASDENPPAFKEYIRNWESQELCTTVSLFKQFKKLIRTQLAVALHL